MTYFFNYATQSTREKLTKGCIPPFPLKGDFGITKNFTSITLTAMSAKVYIILLLDRIQPAIEKFLRKDQNSF